MPTASPSLDDLLAKAAFSSPGIGNNLAMKMVHRHSAIQLILSGTSAGGLPDYVAQNVGNVLKLAKCKRVAADLTLCPMLPSVAIAFLVYYQKTAEECGSQKVILYGVNQRISTLLGMIGMKDFFVVVATEADMVRWYEAHGA